MGQAVSIDIRVLAGSDDAFIAWKSDFIAECRGFALRRRIKRGSDAGPSPNAVAGPDAQGFVEEVVASWVGFADGPDVPEGTRKPTTEWPIQKYLWSDFAVRAGDLVAYRVSPMVGASTTMQERVDLGSPWSDAVEIGGDSKGKVRCYFNRGIVASQWLSRLLPSDPNPKKDTTVKGRALMASIAKPGNNIRDFLAGPLRNRLLQLLTEAKTAKGHVYAALFELDDPELVPLLQDLGKRAHVLLGNGSVKKKGADENRDARDAIKKKCDVKNRFSAPRALAHNKFVVICDSKRRPQAVWTGSTNWTKTGLCTQANNGLLVVNTDVAESYLKQWNDIVRADDATPDTLKESNAKARISPKAKGVTVWFTPMLEQSDLEQAGGLIAGAKQGILFLMFNPGPRGSLLNDIIELASPASQHYRPQLYIQGVLNQDPGTAKNPVTLFNRGNRIDANQDVVLPAAIDTRLKYWTRELKKAPRAHAMVHSKVVVIDPYGDHPVVMTGSHNLGPKASGVNDENFVIIENHGALASQYATKIMEIYNQYRWRASQSNQSSEPRWAGLADDAKWQIGVPGADANTQKYDARRRRELAFWFGDG